GNANIFNGQGAAGFSSVSFSGSSTAGTASVFGLSGTSIGFSGNSSAGNAKITTNDNNSLSFSGSSTAGNATIGLADNTFLGFGDSSTAGNANIGSLGIISFGGSSTGGTAQINLGSDGGHTGLLQIDHDVTIGSLAGITMFGGNPGVSLGANTLTVGSNNLSTTYQGTIGGGGGLTKIGTGTLTLAGTGTLATNTYTGATNVNGGVLQVDGSIASNTFVNNGGTLGGTGTIKNNVTVNNGGTVSPGDSPGTLTIQGALTLNSGATFKFELNSSTAVADKVIANGVTIDGAEFSFTDLGNSMLAVGMIFVVIDDTAMSPITGTFANLPDQSLVTIGSNTFLVNYEGGDGNNLTIQVVPEPSTWLLVVFVSLILVIRRFGILSERRFAQMKGNVS
ncbi:MAG: autotransporter-associated beta strand repeat-containing protein, partial [Chthoniobacterales bacterium]